MHKLAQWVKDKRIKEDMTLIDFGNLVGLSYITIYKIEHGKTVGSKALRQLAAKYNVSVRHLRGLMTEYAASPLVTTDVINK